MKILITGANGLLGERTSGLLAQKYTLLSTDLQDKLLYPSQAPYLMLDITNQQEVVEIIKEFRPDILVNCAAYTNVDGAEKFKDKAWSINVTGVQHLIQTCRPLGTHLIHISSDYIFNGINGPYEEDDRPEPVNYYGKTKLASEKLLEESEMAYTILRTNVLFGNSHRQQANFVYWVIDKLKQRETINIVNDQFGNPTWTDGLAWAVLTVIEKKATGVYHYAGLDYINRFEFALQIADIFGLDNRLIRKTTTQALDQRAKRPFKAGLVSEKIHGDLGVELYGIKEALANMKAEGVRS